MKRMSTAPIWLLLQLLFFSLLPAGAAPAGFNEGVKLYNVRQYKQALAYFTQAAQAAPADPLVRYYMGLSYQGLNQMAQARQQYEWVATCRSNPALAQQASGALQNLSRYQSTRAGSGTVTPPSSVGAPAPAGDPSVPISGRLKILYFTTDW